MNKTSSRTYPVELILEIIQMNEEQHIGPSQLARDYQVPRNTIKFWLKEYRKKGYSAFGGNNRTNHQMTYDGKFKQRVMTYWLENPSLSSYQIADTFSIARSTVRQWKQIYDSKGMDALARETRGAPRKMKRQKQILQSKKSDAEKIQELEKQLKYLQAENEYLKKLNALTCEKILQQKKKK